MRHAATAEPLRTLPAPAVALVTFVPLAAWVAAARTLLPAGAGHSPEALIGTALVVSLAAIAAEALFWRALWAARGARVPFAPLCLALWLLGALESLATLLLARLPEGGAAALWAAPWLGYRALHAAGAADGAFAIAFASTGLFTLARVALSAWAQARLAGRRWREAAAYVTGVWLASHVALAWTIELARGRALGPR